MSRKARKIILENKQQCNLRTQASHILLGHINDKNSNRIISDKKLQQLFKYKNKKKKIKLKEKKVFLQFFFWFSNTRKKKDKDFNFLS